MKIQEQELARIVKCPMMDSMNHSSAEACGYALVTWSIRQSFLQKLGTSAPDILHKLRGIALDLYPGNKSEAGSIARTMAFRVFKLITEYEAIHLEQPYYLELNGYTIQGSYVLLRSRRGNKLPFVLVLHLTEPEMRHQQVLPPDVISMTRYLHVVTTTSYVNARVLHYPIFRGKVWLNKELDLKLTRNYLSDILKVVSLRPVFPIMGDHCNRCISKPCLEIFNGQDDDNR